MSKIQLLHQKAAVKQLNGQRVGQAYFNALSEINANLANNVRTTEFDPFYNNDNLNSFFKYVFEYIKD